MTKGVLDFNQGTNNSNGGEEKDSPLKFLKVGESIVVGIPSTKEFFLKEIVSVYDSVNNVPVILPTVVEKGETTLYDKVLKELWLDYDKAKGSKDEDNKKVLNKVNAIKRQEFVYFGMKDINTGEDIILSMGIATEAGKKAKAGNNFYNAIVKLEKQLKKFPLEITKGELGAWTILPFMDELTPEQEANFKATAELTEETYEKAFFRSSEEKQASDIRKFGAKYGFDVTRVGISPEAEATQEEKKEEGYGF